jgi:hypothetical protein
MLALLALKIELAQNGRLERWTWVLRTLGAYAAAVALKFKNFAPYALMVLVVPGGTLMAPLLWFYRRRSASRTNQTGIVCGG